MPVLFLNTVDQVLLVCALWRVVLCHWHYDRSCHKYHFCSSKHVFVTTKHVFCRLRQNMSFVMTKVCLSQQNFCCDKHIFVTTKHVFCYNKTCQLLWEKYACHNKTFVVTNIFCCDKHILLQKKFCCDKHDFVVKKVLLWQAYFCHCKHVFVVTKYVFCCDKRVMTNICRDKSFLLTDTFLLRQKFCRGKHNKRVMTNICRDKSFLLTDTFLLPQKFCRGKHTFVTTKAVFCHDKRLWHLPPMIILSTLCLS